MPVYLSSIGFTALWIGVLEGFAEAVAGLSKAWFGNLSDQSGRRQPYISTGYFLSAISKPMIVLFTWPLWIFLARCTERLGKGIRTGPRDAMLADESSEANRGKVFGFHRFMDTLGAAIGPACALVYLLFFPGDYKSLFLLAFLPGIAGVLLTFLLKEKKRPDAHPSIPKKPFRFFTYWRNAGTGYRKVTGGLLAFALFNSSDAFLLLIAKYNGLDDTHIIGAYIFYNIVFALASFPAGILADRIGPRKMLVTGILFFILAYAFMPFANTLFRLLLAFLSYGVYAACSEGISKAWISLLCHKEERATAQGFYAGSQSIAALLASVTAGLLWIEFSPLVVFAFSAVGALGVALYFYTLRDDKRVNPYVQNESLI